MASKPRFAFLLSLLLLLLPVALLAENPTSVTIAGTMQKQLGCADNWQPPCETTFLTYDPVYDVWHKTFHLTTGGYEYKAAINGAWAENYGLHAAANGPNIPFNLAADGDVRFYYDNKTHWVTSNKDSIIAVAAGSFQSEIGCSEDWQPQCLKSWLEDPDGDGVYTASLKGMDAGNYEVKVAIDESWDVSYGANGELGGANIPFGVAGPTTRVNFSWDSTTHVLTVQSGGAPPPGPTGPTAVSIPGSYQSKAGCANDWDPACDATQLTNDDVDDVWQGTFNIPAGNYEYKAALNKGWDENYGANATRGGSNLPLVLTSDSAVKFYYDNKTHWVTSNKNSVIATVPGSYQKSLGCNDWDPGCLRSWLQDPDGDGIYTFTTTEIPIGTYEAKVAINEGWDENYGADGAPGGSNIPFEVKKAGIDVFFSYNPTTHVLTINTKGAPKGSLKTAKAYWVLRDTIAWKVATDDTSTYRLFYDPTAGMTLSQDGMQGGQSVALTYDPNGLPASVKDKYPLIAAYKSFKIAAADVGKVPDMLRGQIAVEAKDNEGTVIDATTLQIPGVLDDLYTYNGPLGPTFNAGVPTLRVWAPTAQAVKLLLYDSSSAADPSKSVDMTRDASGVWSATGDASWKNKFYLYAVDVWVRTTGKIEHNVVTDPYSLSLSTNSARSQLVDLGDSALQPTPWNDDARPPLARAEDTVIYELHVRDFSANDASVPAAKRGTFMAFTEKSSNGMKHLKSLADAGLTHIHLLPSFDFATVNEDKSKQQTTPDLSGYGPDSEQQQAEVGKIKDQDAFNWGYDPWHYTVPEGSYSTDPDGSKRIVEFRSMVQSLHESGLRVVMDVVYNHTTASGENDKSVLDKVVPGYYHRLNANGEVETSTCCQNTATENNMMRKLMVDSVVTWAKDYKVDGFRFDLMGHHMKADMEAVRNALNALTVDKNGVDGTQIYVYGEGWNFGEVASDARGVNATQMNMAGTGIGTFNDRMRDGVRGGSPFTPKTDQGFATGLWSDPNGTSQGTADEQLARLEMEEDWIRVGLAGSINNFKLMNAAGSMVKASEIDYNGQQSGYTEDPQEVINYMSAHDNETIFDAIQFKAPATATMLERVRRNNLAVDLVMLAQGIPFFHAGDEMLRSKSLDGNSYNSGDWFNRLDFTYGSSNFGVGVPPAADNQANWGIMKPLLADPALKPTSADIRKAVDHFKEMLQIRKSSDLFRLASGPEVRVNETFYNSGPNQVPGIIVMALRNKARYGREMIVVVFNGNRETKSVRIPELANAKLQLNFIQKNGTDDVVKQSKFESEGKFTVPGLTTAVFVGKRPWDDR